MDSRKKILAICGSTRSNSTNLQLIKAIAEIAAADIDIEIYSDLSFLPHFNPDLDNEAVPDSVKIFRSKIENVDGILICTPEYVFSLPGSLKNAIEWMVSTTLFSGKPVALITASGLGEKAHESLLLIMKTVEAKFTEQTQLHISGARTKVNMKNKITDAATMEKIKLLLNAFINLINEK
ncbi:MAG: NADPH-dependent FMN reductase [Ferruginibacter sp.]